MIYGLFIGFVVWSIQYSTYISAVLASKYHYLDRRRLLSSLAIFLFAGVVWGGITRFLLTGSFLP